MCKTSYHLNKGHCCNALRCARCQELLPLAIQFCTCACRSEILTSCKINANYCIFIRHTQLKVWNSKFCHLRSKNMIQNISTKFIRLHLHMRSVLLICLLFVRLRSQPLTTEVGIDVHAREPEAWTEGNPMFINWQTMALMLSWSRNTGCGHLNPSAESGPPLLYCRGRLDLIDKNSSFTSGWVEWDKCGVTPSMPIPSHASLVTGHVKFSSSEPAET